MDAMLHNLNAARYLMGRRVVGRAFFSDDHTHSLACDDTVFKVDFLSRASAHLFITWAAELAVYDSAKTTGNTLISALWSLTKFVFRSGTAILGHDRQSADQCVLSFWRSSYTASSAAHVDGASQNPHARLSHAGGIDGRLKRRPFNPPTHRNGARDRVTSVMNLPGSWPGVGGEQSKPAYRFSPKTISL